MQQIFDLVNILLNENAETRKRRLSIRTYKVIPLSPVAGLLEWVENTIPIGEYLIGTYRDQLNCAHVKYRRKDKVFEPVFFPFTISTNYVFISFLLYTICNFIVVY